MNPALGKHMTGQDNEPDGDEPNAGGREDGAPHIHVMPHKHKGKGHHVHVLHSSGKVESHTFGPEEQDAMLAKIGEHTGGGAARQVTPNQDTEETQGGY